MVYVVDHSAFDDFTPALDEMFHHRRSMFVERLGWPLRVDERGHERDEFDTRNALYFLDLDRDTGALLGSLRLLRTDAPHLLSVHFPHLCEAAAPAGEDVFEVSRFVTAQGLERERTMRVRHRLASALMEYGVDLDLSAYTLVTHLSWLPTLLCVGWTCRPLGLPHALGRESIGALTIEVSQQGLAELRRFGGRYPVIRNHHTEPPSLAEEGATYAV